MHNVKTHLFVILFTKQQLNKKEASQIG